MSKYASFKFRKSFIKFQAVQNSEYGNNYYEIRGGKEMTPKLAAEIISSMGKDAHPRLKVSIFNEI